MVNLHNLHKIKIPTIQVRLLAVMLIGVLFTSVAFAAGIRDYGQDPDRQCRKPSFGSMGGPDTTDWSTVPPGGFGPASTLDSDDTIPNCKTMEQISYTSDPTGPGTVTYGSHWRYSCAECNSGYHKRSHSMPSTVVVDCVVTWEECVKDTPCDGLVCEGKTSWTNVSGENYQTRCNTGTNRCEYQCKSNYYNAGGMLIFGGTPNCKACPAHAECRIPDNPPCCDGGYYLIDHNYAEAGGGITVTRTKDYECLRCPSIGGVYGETPDRCPTVPPTPSFITWCYIPSNTNITVTEGTFQFTKDCPYTEDE